MDARDLGDTGCEECHSLNSGHRMKLSVFRMHRKED